MLNGTHLVAGADGARAVSGSSYALGVAAGQIERVIVRQRGVYARFLRIAIGGLAGDAAGCDLALPGWVGTLPICDSATERGELSRIHGARHGLALHHTEGYGRKRVLRKYGGVALGTVPDLLRYGHIEFGDRWNSRIRPAVVRKTLTQAIHVAAVHDKHDRRSAHGDGGVLRNRTARNRIASLDVEIHRVGHRTGGVEALYRSALGTGASAVGAISVSQTTVGRSLRRAGALMRYFQLVQRAATGELRVFRPNIGER